MIHLLFLLPFIHQLSWSDYKGPQQIRWENFKGLPKNNGYAASVNTRWILTDSCEDGKCYFKVDCGIDEDSSWTTTNSEIALRHEQTHVNLSYIVCRDFKRVLSKYQGISESKAYKVHNLFNNWWAKERRVNALFDRETKHSVVTVIEKQWEDQINKALCEGSH